MPPVVVAAAGRGTRMKHLSANAPKHLIKVEGRPFLYYLLGNLYRAGVTRVFLVIGYQSAAAYAFVAQYRQQYPVTVINQFECLGEERYGTLMPLLALTPELKGQAVAVVNGDNLYSSADLARLLAHTPRAAVAAQEHSQPERYGVIVPSADGYLDHIEEKPLHPRSRLINTGLYSFSPSVWDIAPTITPSVRGEYELTEAVNALAKREPVAVEALRDYWLDLGRPEDIDQATTLIRTLALAQPNEFNYTGEADASIKERVPGEP